MNKKAESNWITYAMLVFVMVLWGSNGVAGKFVLRDLPVFTVNEFRILLSSIVLFWLLRREKGLFIPQRRDWPMFLILGFTGIFASSIFLYLALTYTSATNTALIIAGSPIVITILSALMLKERISLLQLTGIILSFSGVVIVISKGSWNVLVSLGFNIGDLIMLGNPVSWALYTILTKKVVDRYSPLAIGSFSHLVGFVLFVPFVIYELTTLRSAIHVSAVNVGIIAYMGLVASSFGMLWWNKAVEKVGASRAGIFLNSIPVITIILSAVLLREKITIPQVLGALMVIIGVYLNSFSATTRKRSIANKGKYIASMISRL